MRWYQRDLATLDSSCAAAFSTSASPSSFFFNPKSGRRNLVWQQYALARSRGNIAGSSATGVYDEIVLARDHARVDEDGALIVIERNVGLKKRHGRGVKLEAELS